MRKQSKKNWKLQNWKQKLFSSGKKHAEYQSQALKVEEQLVKIQAKAKMLEEKGKIHTVMMHRSKEIPFDEKGILEVIKTLDLVYKVARVNVEAPHVSKKTTTVGVLANNHIKSKNVTNF